MPRTVVALCGSESSEPEMDAGLEFVSEPNDGVVWQVGYLGMSLAVQTCGESVCVPVGQPSSLLPRPKPRWTGPRRYSGYGSEGTSLPTTGGRTAEGSCSMGLGGSADDAMTASEGDAVGKLELQSMP
jgi:hypothetical protein